jgi:hypothetical protein
MSTYLLYLFILFFSTLNAYVYEKTEQKNQQIVFFFFSFLFPFVFVALRYNIGIDYPSYVEFFYNIQNGNYLVAEPGYVLLNIIVDKLGLDYQWVFIVVGFFTLFFFYKALPKDGFALAIFILISIYYFDGLYKNIRQALAISIMAYASKHIYDKNFFIYMLYAFVAMSFHLATGFILLFAYFLRYIRVNKYILIILFMVGFVIVELHLIKPLLLSILNVVLPKYAGYLNTDYFGAPPQGTVGYIRLLIYLFLSMSIIFNREKIEEKNPHFNLIINMLFLYMLFYIFKFDSQIFLRAQDIFVFNFVLSLVYFIKIFSAKSRIIVMYPLVLMYIVLFISRIYQGDISDPNSQQLRPYQNILFDRE